jgi:tetratricopeptide (TPR) repeat protein
MSTMDLPVKPSIRHAIRRTLQVASLLAACAYGPALYAAGADCAAPPPKTEAATMSEGVYADVQASMELLSKQKYNEAIEKLSKIADKGSDYEKAVVNYNLGFAYSSKNDTPGAAKSFAKALSFNALPRSQREQLQYNLGQIYIVIGQHDDGIKVLQQYIATACGNIPAEAHIFLANSLSEKKRFAEALPQIDLALAKAKEPKETWLQMKLAISYEMKDFKGCADALVQLIGVVPAKAEYWRQLSSMFYEMKQDAQSVAVLALAERQGFVQKPNEIKNLYSVYMMMELPYKAGVLLQDAVEKNKIPGDEANLESIADAWINARETTRAEAALKKLAGISEKGEYYFKLGAMYGDEERWKESREMLEKALQKGSLKRAGEVWMRLAVAHYGMKNTPAAVVALRKAVDFPETKKQAGEWLRHLSGQVAAEQTAAPATEAAT